MNAKITMALLLLGGVGAGAGGGFSMAQLIPSPSASNHVEHGEKASPIFVDAGALSVPVLSADGQLSGYVEIAMQIEVNREEDVEPIGARVPALWHAVNIAIWDKPLSTKGNTLLPESQAFAAEINRIAPNVLGADRVRRILVTAVRPL